MKVKSESEVAQSCPTLSDPMEGSLPGSSTHGIFQATVLEWGANCYCFACVKAQSLKYTKALRLRECLNTVCPCLSILYRVVCMHACSAIPQAVAHQIPLSMEFSRQEYWNGLPFPPPGDLPNPGIELTSPALAGRFFTTEPPGKPQQSVYGNPKILIYLSHIVLLW